MDYKDYYAVMGVDRDASQDEIKKAYRRLARKYHPDVSDQADAEERFKELGEAYTVLKDPEKRAAYDELGANWQAGQDFRPPPDWDAGFEFSGRGFEGSASYSDFFEELFGRRTQAGGFDMHGQDHHAKILIDIDDSYHGATRTISLRMPEVDQAGHVVTRDRQLSVQIPKGIREGQRIRLAGQGSTGIGEGRAGDLFLEVGFRAHSRYRVDGSDVYMDLPLAPWEAALGETINIPTPDGRVDLRVPAGTRAGQKLRLKGRGIPGSHPGDFYAVIELTLPPADSAEATDFYRKMRDAMPYNPRQHLEA